MDAARIERCLNGLFYPGDRLMGSFKRTKYKPHHGFYLLGSCNFVGCFRSNYYIFQVQGLDLNVGNIKTNQTRIKQGQ